MLSYFFDALTRRTMISMTNTRFWWPLQLSSREEKGYVKFRQRMLENPIEINNSLNKNTIDQIDYFLRQNIVDILEKDGLPHHCHLINGWGNSTFRGQRLISSMETFAHRDENSEYFILQCNPEGDFHPWQSFAYAAMAGVDFDEPISSREFTLRTLAKNSRKINTSKGIELGHLLFALVFIEPNLNAPPFFLEGKPYTVKELMDLAVEEHHYGSFDVCRKFHLTEGLCAASTKIPGLESYRDAAQGFLDGQMDMLLLLGIVIQEARTFQDKRRPLENNSLIREIRSDLRLGNLIENHCYYAGHLIELACFAADFGFSIKEEYWQAMAYIINELNITLPSYLPFLSYQDHFYAVGHYRRAITLLPDVMEARISGRRITSSILQKFSINFDMQRTLIFSNQDVRPPSVQEGGVYNISIVKKNSREKFLSVVEQYSQVAGNLKPRGKFDHFRRIGPTSWPRAFHYEILDYDNQIGAEIHLESDSVIPLREVVKNLREKIQTIFKDNLVEWDASWCHGLGRLRVLFEDSCSAKDIVNGISLLIKNTYFELDQLASQLETNPINKVQSVVA